MYNINESSLGFNSANFREIGFNPYVDKYNIALFESPNLPYTRYNESTVHILKSNSDYIPIICLMNSSINSYPKVGKQDFVQALTYLALTKLFGYSVYGDVERIIELEQISNSSMRQLYDELTKLMIDNNYSRNIPVQYHNYGYDNNIRISDVDNLVFNSIPGHIYGFDNKRSLAHLFYYTYEGQILLTMVIKRDKILEFKENLNNKVIDPKHVEIWVDKNIVEGNDRKQFHKHLRENVMMSLFMRGFKIKEKDNILDELIVKPQVKFKNIDELKEFKENLNKFLVS